MNKATGRTGSVGEVVDLQSVTTARGGWRSRGRALPGEDHDDEPHEHWQQPPDGSQPVRQAIGVADLDQTVEHRELTLPLLDRNDVDEDHAQTQQEDEETHETNKQIRHGRNLTCVRRIVL